MTEEQTTQKTAPDAEQVEAILRKHIYGAMGVGLVPIPLVDFIGFSAIELNLIRALSKEYNVPFKVTEAKEIICALIGGGAGVAGTTLLASLVKFIPFIGTTTGTLSATIIGGAVTYATGRLIIRHYDKGGSLDDFNTDEAKEAFGEVVAEGKVVAAKIAAETKNKAKAVKKATEQYRNKKSGQSSQTKPATDIVEVSDEDASPSSDTTHENTEK
ncbi:MAG: DUF697 domain-containing protein [Pontiellaceae bacterium]|nr:DUF697 domain-containing protein [Pontiellaceae bacterium]